MTRIERIFTDKNYFYQLPSPRRTPITTSLFRRDYIQRMIEEFGKMLGHVMGLKTMNQPELALDELRKGYKTYFGLDALFIRGIHKDELLEALLSKGELKSLHLEAIAQALMTEGELLHTTDLLLATDLRKKALLLYLHLEKHDNGTFSMIRKTAISELESILENE
ncbi:MAG: hypothetical protein ABIQ40_10810 [Bacteroidia bacterium]